MAPRQLALARGDHSQGSLAQHRLAGRSENGDHNSHTLREALGLVLHQAPSPITVQRARKDQTLPRSNARAKILTSLVSSALSKATRQKGAPAYALNERVSLAPTAYLACAC